MSAPVPPPPLGPSWNSWGEKLNSFLVRTRDVLRFKNGNDSAAENGILMWDAISKHPVVSREGDYMPLSYGYNSYGVISDTTDQTLSSNNTATAITWNTNDNSKNISIDSTTTSKIVFAKAGRYHISFNAQITSGSSSAKIVWFFPRINGTNVEGSTMKVTCTGNSETQIQSRAGIFDVSANDYLESMWACDSTNITLEAAPSTAFAPATTSVTLMITEINA
jgi:hypothetical protein